VPTYRLREAAWESVQGGEKTYRDGARLGVRNGAVLRRGDRNGRDEGSGLGGGFGTNLDRKEKGMSRETIMAGGAPEPAGPYSHAVVANGFVYVSGQGPVNPETGSAPDGFEDQVRQTFENLGTILEAAGSGFDEVVKVNAYVTDLTRFARFNEVYKEFFARDQPARTTVGADLLGILVEVDCVAVVRGDG
jgi:2-iminobutanoate/2-iminopropanoate deaminase